ncbi:MAG: aldolase/citrate lyase family protein [bacterium]|nr:aldolase/citrate lyase family protein [bacterium]
MDNRFVQMRESRVLKKLRAGEVAYTFKLNLSDARVSELVSMFNFDCIWVDMEHTASDWSIVEQHIWAAKSQGTDVMVRAARGGYSDYIRPLELDAAGIMIPHIMSLADAREVVRLTRFYPLGRRPLDGGNADGGYCNIDLQTYCKGANEQRFVAIQIEDPEALVDLEEIAALEGIDIIFFGPGDFSQAIGVPGQLRHPEVLRVQKLVAETAGRHGKFAGTVGNPEILDELIDWGYTYINLGADVHGLNKYLKELAPFLERSRACAV